MYRRRAPPRLRGTIDETRDTRFNYYCDQGYGVIRVNGCAQAGPQTYTEAVWSRGNVDLETRPVCYN